MILKQLDRTAASNYKECPVRILQFGEGNFLRAFADWMIDIANEKGVFESSVAIISPRFSEGKSVRILKKQGCMYHVILEGIEKGQPKRQTRLIRSVSEVLAPASQDDYDRYMALITSPDLRFVLSNTTEAGIRFENDNVLADRPETFPGKVTGLLWRRYNHFRGDAGKGLIFICCELIEDNASTLRRYVLRHAVEAGLPQDFIEWIDKANIFADSLVDRIVPGYPHDTIDIVRSEIGYNDEAVVKGELYHLWAIGGNGYETVAREFPLDKAGLNVLFMPSIKDFRDKKVRILNGSHTGMVPIGLLSGYESVSEAFGDPAVNRFIRGMAECEVLPMIDGDSSVLQAFADSILERFYNPYMKHYLKSIALNSLSKWEARNFPTVRDMWQKKHRLADFGLFTFAALLSLYGPGSGFVPEDNASHIAAINSLWNEDDYRKTVADIVESGIFVENFDSAVPGFSERVSDFLAAIRLRGMTAALADFLNDHK